VATEDIGTETTEQRSILGLNAFHQPSGSQPKVDPGHVPRTFPKMHDCIPNRLLHIQWSRCSAELRSVELAANVSPTRGLYTRPEVVDHPASTSVHQCLNAFGLSLQDAFEEMGADHVVIPEQRNVFASCMG
jgi:hypothetical protein